MIEKINKLRNIISRYNKVSIAFSGGKDSLFLVKIAIEVLGKENVKIIFINTDFIGKNDRKRVSYFEKKFNLEIIRLKTDVLKKKEIRENHKSRCYFCKTMMFKMIFKYSEKFGIETIFDGTTASDIDEFRPGTKALKELNILSPLRDVEIQSNEIIEILKKEKIDDYYLTSSTCLATRFPYDYDLKKDEIQSIDSIEDFLIENKIYPLRVRKIGNGFRIDTIKNNFDKILILQKPLIEKFKKGNINFVSLNLAELKSGIWD